MHDERLMASEDVQATWVAESGESSLVSPACDVWACEALAYDLHLRKEFHCRRQGGQSICGVCASDLVWGFALRRATVGGAFEPAYAPRFPSE